MTVEDRTSTEFITEKIMSSGDIKDAEEVRNFALLWNMFELLIIKERKFVNVINYKIEELIRLSDYDELNKMFLYFKERYGDNGLFDIRFLKLEENCNSRVKRLLKNESNNKSNCTFVVFHIIRRIRNNFFHGSKEYHELSSNEDLFRKINLFLIPYIEKAYEEELT